jgi:8-oxo-dGTP pyrophosphatase MutT (NUDIX family)
MKTITKLKENIILSNKFLTIYNDDVELPDKTKSTYIRLGRQDGVIILPLTNNLEIITQEEFRYPIGKFVRHLPMGAIDDSEKSHKAAAERELLEELGYKSGNLILVDTYHSNASINPSLTYAYIATDCVVDDDAKPENTEIFRKKKLTPISKVDQLLCETRCTASKALIRHFISDQNLLLPTNRPN